MKKIIVLSLFLLTVSFDNNKEDAFQVGEWFKFRIHYGLINAGYATLEVKDAVKAWGAKDSKPWSFASTMEAAVESIPNTFVRNFDL